MDEVRVAKVALAAATYAIDKPYDYLAGALSERVVPGVRVLVPFGRGNRLVQGMVFSVEAENAGHLKEVVSVLDPEPLLDENAFGIVEFMADTTFCTYYDAVRCLIPAGLSVTARESFALAHAPDRGILPNLPEDERELLRLMRDLDELYATLCNEK